MATITERNITRRMPTNDVFQTSAGVGHHYRPGYYFPDSTFRSFMLEPLPADLCKPSEILPSDHLKSTYSTYHDPKYNFEPYKNPLDFKRAPGHWNVHYLKDHKEKLNHQKFRRPLSPSNQQSETTDEFCNRPPLFEPERWKSFQPFNLDNHHKDGPSKHIIASTKNPKLAGRTLYPKDQEVLRHLDPYLTTTMKYHRVWDPKELKGYPKKDATTFWDCENYPKAWGHGLKHNPLPRDAVPRERPPMRDTMIFKSATQLRRVPQSLVPVPHSGLKTVYGDSFQKPSDVKSTEATYCPVDNPFVLPEPGPRTGLSAPQMYRTEYENIGNETPVVV